jgi:Zn-dependent protease with chaperone function
MKELVYPHERTLGAITLVLGVLVWLLLVLGTFGIALIVLAVGFVLYLFLQSALIGHIKGNGVAVTAEQFPDLHAQFVECCERLQISHHPQAYVLNGEGGLNAFATKFLGTRYVVLLSDVVDAMEAHADGVRFYLGHELGHLRRKHLNGHLLRWPVLWLPLLGAAYARACESTCDRHGLACSNSPEGAVQALAALSAGSERWKRLDIPAYLRQVAHTSGFWMSFHELTAGYPWLTKRAARLMGAPVPRRNPFAWLLAAIIPYAGRLGGGFGLLILVYVGFVVAAIALPAYNDYVTRAKVATAVIATVDARESLAAYYEANQAVPESLEAVGIASTLPDGTPLSLDSNDMQLTASLKEGELHFTPRITDDGRIFWTCSGDERLKAAKLSISCNSMGVQ